MQASYAVRIGTHVCVLASRFVSWPLFRFLQGTCIFGGCHWATDCARGCQIQIGSPCTTGMQAPYVCVYLRVCICVCAFARVHWRVRACVPSPRQRVSRPPSCTPRVHTRTRLECVKNTPPLVPASKSAARLHAVDRQQIHVENLRIYVHMS